LSVLTIIADIRNDAPMVDELLTALADPHRRQVVELLVDRPRRAGELAAAVGVSPPVMSRHLKVLLQAGLVVDERPPEDARARRFRLRPDSLVALQAWLDQLQAQWDEQLASFKRHVERTRDTPEPARPDERNH
jgi:DNA-binding transcriptional ArsR family regulator